MVIFALETKKPTLSVLMQPVEEKKYIAIDLKSFYASVECVERKLDALDTCLVVADESRTQKTICLAVSPALKSFGIGGRPRLFEVIEKVNSENRRRGLHKKSYSKRELDLSKEFAVDYIVALPRMGLYLDYSRRIYEIYLRYISPEDIHIYSVDEVFIDATPYMKLYGLSAHDLAMFLVKKIVGETGITATAGIGTNLYLAKVAMDIVAKKMVADNDGVRVAEIDENSYRHGLWEHMPLTDFWRVGRGVVKRLSKYGLYTMGDIARCSIEREDILYKLLGVNAELLIDHAWGHEPVTMKEIKSYRPESHSISNGQVLSRPYNPREAYTVILEMADTIALELTEKGLTTDQMVITIGYDVESLAHLSSDFKGKIKKDFYGRDVPHHSQGTLNFTDLTASGKIIIKGAGELFKKIVEPTFLIRRLNISLTHLHEIGNKTEKSEFVGNLFPEFEKENKKNVTNKTEETKDINRQKAVLEIKDKFGKNSILKGFNFSEGATQRERNRQIGGHRE